ncbi:hypothetical protein MGN70_014400 [Eutypa lata]|nr:hypothetical protein MGN70_014400 [Eutypa lata]
MDLVMHPISLVFYSAAAAYFMPLYRWHLSLLLLGILNFKALPFIYTLRILPALLRLYAFPTPPRPLDVATLFAFHTTQSRVSLCECDVNLHKSNSTFLVDLDISRAELLSRLLSGAYNRLSRTAIFEGDTPKNVNIILAGVDVSFHRELLPGQIYQIRSRILSWDHKWMFVISYMVQTGIRLDMVDREGGRTAVMSDQKIRKKVFAVAISKYVVKVGRRTVPPQKLLEAVGSLKDLSRDIEERRISGLDSLYH